MHAPSLVARRPSPQAAYSKIFPSEYAFGTAFGTLAIVFLPAIELVLLATSHADSLLWLHLARPSLDNNTQKLYLVKLYLLFSLKHV